MLSTFWYHDYELSLFQYLQFVDLCILLGCDYCESIRGIGPKRAIELVSQYKCIEEILKNIDKSKYIVPEDWNYEQARGLFHNPEVADPETVEVRPKYIYRDFKKPFLPSSVCQFILNSMKQ